MQVNGLNIYVKMIGKGKPIIFLHGGPGDEHHYFLPHVEPLANHFTLIFYDQRGCGKSEKPGEEDYSLETEVETLEGLRKKLGITKVNLLGQSWGTILALLYATSYPANIEKLMLVSAIGSVGEDLTAFGEQLKKRMTKEDQKKLSDLEKRKTMPEHELKQIIYPYYLYDRSNITKLTDTTINEVANQRICKDIEENYHIIDKLTLLSDIPIFILQGEYDLITTGMLKTSLLSYVPHAQLETYDQSGHWPFIEETEKFLKQTKAFFLTNE